VAMIKFNNKGFTLVEIIVAIAVVGIVGIAFSGFSINSARMISALDEREKAIIIAQTELEQLKAQEFNEIDLNNYPYQKEIYNIDLQMEAEDDSSLYKITVIVNWDQNKDLELVSYVSEG